MFSTTFSSTSASWVLTPRGLSCVGPEDGTPRLRDDNPGFGYTAPLQARPPAGDEELAREMLADAVAAGDVEAARGALDAGASAIWAPVRGRHRNAPPLSVAARGPRPAPLLRLLLERAAEEDAAALWPAASGALEAWTSGFVSVQEHAAEARAKLRLLLEFQADVNARVEHTGETVLHTAARAFALHRGRMAEGGEAGKWAQLRSEAARFKFMLLLQARGDPELRSRDRYETPLELAGQQFGRELLQPGKDQQELPAFQQTPPP